MTDSKDNEAFIREAETLASLRQEVEQLTRNYIEKLLDSRSSSQEHANFLQTIIDSIADGLIVYDSNENVLLVNRAALRLVGLTPGSIPSSKDEIRRIYKFFRNSSGQRILPNDEPYSIAIREKRSVEMEGIIVGDTIPSPGIWLRSHASPVLDERHNLLGVVTTFHDITERKAMQQQRDALASLITHDVKNHLVGMNHILDYLLNLSAKFSDADSFKELLEAAQISSNHHLELVSSLMELYRMDFASDGRSDLEVDLEKVLEIVLFLTNLEATFKGVKIEPAIEESLPKIKGEPAAIRHVFLNLLQNAVKTSSSGQTVRVSLKRHSKEVVFSVSDSGKGLSEAEIAKLFNPEQVATRLPGLDRSLGMGLFVSKILMDAQRATISCHSQPGVGTTFEVKIPV